MPQRTSSKPRLNSSIKASGRRAKADLEKRARRARSVSSRGRSKIDLLQPEGDRNQRGGEKRQSRAISEKTLTESEPRWRFLCSCSRPARLSHDQFGALSAIGAISRPAQLATN